MQIDKLLPGIKKNISLKDYTTFQIGGPAKYFFIAESKKELIKAIKLSKKIDLPFFILGKGSNLLVADKGFQGLVVKILFSKFYFLNSKIIVEAGTLLGKLVNASANAGLVGLEWAAGIPGTIGGAIYGNAAAFGNSISQAIESVEVFDCESLKTKKIYKKFCKFSTKNSIFKRNENLIILSAVLKLKKGGKKPAVYTQGIQKKIREYLNYRKEKHPRLPSAGSVFVNPEVKIKNKNLLNPFPQLEKFNKKGFIPAGFLIEKCGLKGKRVGGIKISEKHANFIVNFGNGRAKDVIKLVKLVKERVKKKFGIALEEEIHYLGF